MKFYPPTKEEVIEMAARNKVPYVVEYVLDGMYQHWRQSYKHEGIVVWVNPRPLESWEYQLQQ